MVMTFGWRTQLFRHRPLSLYVREIRYCSSVAAVSTPSAREQVKKIDKDDEWRLPSLSVASQGKGSGDDDKKTAWKELDADKLGISNSMITKPTWIVLNGLKKKGYEVYLVGGCVRDLILKRIPKDFDIITSAQLKEVRKAFRQCEIVGTRFPICIVHVDSTIVEVSSFSTHAKKSNPQFNRNFSRPSGCSNHDYIRWKNSLHRDFTINGLIFDPYAKIVYDYIGGIDDLRKARVCTVIPASLSFAEDTARVLRAIRVAARLGFRLNREIALSFKELSHSVMSLNQGRIHMELNHMLAYGSAEASLRLLWRFGLLEILLPIQASYFVSQGFQRRDEKSNMLLSLFSNLDRLVAPDRPCHSSLWIGMFAFHQALVDHPQDPFVIAAFSLAVHSGGSLLESVEIARRMSRPYESSFHELLKPKDLDSNTLKGQVINFAAFVQSAIRNMTDGYHVSQAMRKYPQAPHSDLVFISAALSSRVCSIFECVRRGREKGPVPKREGKIDYESLASGSLSEVRHTLARIIFDTVFPPKQSSENDLVKVSP